VTLDPYAPMPLSIADLKSAARGGLLAVDGSWNRLAARGRFPGAGRAGSDRGARRLPFLLARNPQHFGKWAQLNTVEALAAALFLLGRPEQAAGLLEGFRGGPTFLEINRARLERYASARSGAEVLAAEREIFTSEEPAGRGATPAREA
jgi:pre-rRNA-processing protein TSR3